MRVSRTNRLTDTKRTRTTMTRIQSNVRTRTFVVYVGIYVCQGGVAVHVVVVFVIFIAFYVAVAIIIALNI